MLVAIAVAGASSAVMAHFCDRVGARRLLWIALLAWAVLLCVLALMHEKWAFAAALVLTEVAGGAIDTAMNAEASHRLVDHPSVLVRLHALFNAGALTGAAAAAVVIHAGVSWRWMWPAIAVVALAVGVWASAATDSGAPMAAASTGSSHPLRRLRRDGLLCCGGVALAEITEGGVDTWGVLYLRNTPRNGRAARGRRLRGRAGRGGDHPGGRRAGTRAAGQPAGALVIGGCVAGAGILLESLTSLRASPRSGWRSGRGARRCSGRSS